MSILKEIKEQKSKKYVKIFFIIFFIGILLSYYFYNKIQTQKTTTQIYKLVKRDILSTQSADGKVYYKEQYNLDFPTSGTLAKIYKNEGDELKSGDIIATLDDTYLQINLDKAKIALTTANANLQAKLASKGQAGDINISEAQLNSNQTTLQENIKQGKEDVANYEDNLESTQKDLENGKKSTQTDIDNATKSYNSAISDLENNQNILETIKNQENLNIANSIQKIQLDIDSIISQNESILKNIDQILGVTDLNKNYNDYFEVYLGAKNSQIKSEAENSFRIALNSNEDFKNFWNQNKNITTEKIANFLDLLNKISFAGEKTYETLKNSIISSNYSQTTLDNQTTLIYSDLLTTKSNIIKITTDNQNISTAQTSLENKVKNQTDVIKSYEIKAQIAKGNLDKVVINSKNTIDSLNSKVVTAQNQLTVARIKLQSNINLANSQINISKANLDYKKDSIDSRELEPFYTAIKSAQKGIEEAGEKLKDSQIISPINGKIGKLSTTKIGSQISINPTSPFVTIINKNSLYVEAKIEEGDIAKIKLGQKVKIGFNSLENVELSGKVSYISDKAETDVNSIVTYKVEIIFDKISPEIKEGFTAQLYFVMQEKKGVLSLPIEVFKEENSKKFVNLKSGKKVEITTGIDDGDYIEIISGLKESDEIIN